MAYDAFVSYRRSDRITADGVARFLDAFGLNVFVDRSSRAGTAWEPALRDALASTKVLVVLWSRSAAHSSWVEREWRSVSPSCRIVSIKLDGEPLPDELERLTAVEGLDVGSRLLQRTFELMQQGKLSPAEAQQRLLKELASDGVVLEPKQREALAVFLGFVAGTTAMMGLRDDHLARASDSLQPSTHSSPPSALGRRTWAALLGATSGLAAGAFLVGYHWRDPVVAAPALTPECPPAAISDAGVSASTCPESPPCPLLEPIQAPACPCSAQQCARGLATTANDERARRELKACQRDLTTTTTSLRACIARGPRLAGSDLSSSVKANLPATSATAAPTAPALR